MKALLSLLFVLLLASAANFQLAGSADATVLDQMRRATISERKTELYSSTDKFMEDYYIEKRVNRISHFLVVLDRSKMLTDYPASMPVIAGFMAVQFMEHPEHTLEWLSPPPDRRNKLASARYSDETVDMLQYATWLAGRSGEEKISRLFSRKPSYLADKLAKLSELPIQVQGDLDVMWGAFLASGDGVYIRRVVDAACGFIDAAKNPVPDPQLMRLASGSLFENARPHEIVRREIRKYIADPQSFCHEEKLNPLLPSAPLPSAQMDGDFAADLLLANYDAAIKLMDGPLEKVMHLSPVTHVKPGDKIGILITFSGMEMKDDLSTDMDYDLTITGPDGRPVEKGEMKKLPIKPVKYTGRYILLHPAAFMAIGFEKDYPPGNYGVNIELRDNIGHKKIPLRQQVEFAIPAEEKKP